MITLYENFGARSITCIYVMDTQLHSTVFCGMQLFIYVINTCCGTKVLVRPKGRNTYFCVNNIDGYGKDGYIHC